MALPSLMSSTTSPCATSPSLEDRALSKLPSKQEHKVLIPVIRIPQHLQPGAPDTMTTSPPPVAGTILCSLESFCSLTHMADVQYLVPTLDHTMLDEDSCAPPGHGPLGPSGQRLLRGGKRLRVAWWIAIGAHGVIAATTIDAYAVVDAALANYFDDGHGVVVEQLESLASRMTHSLLVTWTRRVCQGG
ncbi:hypothetical protein BJV78DRAFT_1363943 [Lactifluus subvellereus]|nr:hypothetical protein BJV78DRAFT_1363943 [Lactifluus subvellereus]